MRLARDAAVVVVLLALPVVTTVACGLATKASPHANATARLTTKPPLCQVCAKTGKHSPTIRGTEWPRTSR
jgi:hypothetical protein